MSTYFGQNSFKHLWNMIEKLKIKNLYFEHNLNSFYQTPVFVIKRNIFNQAPCLGHNRNAFDQAPNLLDQAEII